VATTSHNEAPPVYNLSMTHQNSQHPLYFNYWGKAKKPIEIDYCLSNGSDKEIARRYSIPLKKLEHRAAKNNWKKVTPGETYPAYHLLPYHSLDVTAVASVWWDHSQTIQNSFRRYAGNIPPSQMKSWVLFYVALHDYGKFDLRFQRKALNAWKSLWDFQGQSSLILPTTEACKNYDHGSAGLFWYYNDHRQGEASGKFDLHSDIFELITTETEDNTIQWIKAVTGHHGFVYGSDSPLPDRSMHSTVSKTYSQQDNTARKAWIETLEQLLLKPEGLSFNDIPPIPSSLLAGFCSVSDWLGSRSDDESFRYVPEPTNDLNAYFDEKCREDATRVFRLSGIGGKSKPYQGVEALLKKDHKPHQLQTLVMKLPAAPGLTVVEAPTGSGKTEMALAYAWRLLEGNHADSIIFAMPTQATSNAMFTRLEKLATVIFEENPNLLLAHGNARFNEEFIALKQSGNTVQQKKEAWAQCNEWLSQSRKRIFLGQIGICTIDQVLVSVLPVKHRFIRGFGIGRSVLIIDEVHAYDAYMYGLLDAVLKEQQAVGGSSILLSATLPLVLKNKLLATSGVKLSKKSTNKFPPYPLISYSDGKEVIPFTLSKSRKHLPPLRPVTFELHEDAELLPDETLRQRIISAAKKGAQVAVICNLVDIAQELAKKLQEILAQECIELDVDIFHARYCLTDRQVKENSVLKKFGEEGKRSKGHILVATQVIEQSLDVDFDWIITQLCPIDLLFQRMGRLHRHQRSRPDGFATPLCTILLPPGNDYGAHGLIYSNSRVMWRTAQRLRDCTERTIEFPAAYREWIEPVYKDEKWGSEPPEIEVGFKKFEQEQNSKVYSANQMLKWAKDAALNDSDEKIRAVTRDGEFSLSVVPYLETPGGKCLLNSKIFEELDEWQQAEALSMSTVNVPNSWGNGWNKFLPEQDKNGYIWLAMKDDGEYWRVTCNDVDLSYHPEWGMEKYA